MGQNVKVVDLVAGVDAGGLRAISKICSGWPLGEHWTVVNWFCSPFCLPNSPPPPPPNIEVLTPRAWLRGIWPVQISSHQTWLRQSWLFHLHDIVWLCIRAFWRGAAKRMKRIRGAKPCHGAQTTGALWHCLVVWMHEISMFQFCTSPWHYIVMPENL